MRISTACSRMAAAPAPCVRSMCGGPTRAAYASRRCGLTRCCTQQRDRPVAGSGPRPRRVSSSLTPAPSSTDQSHTDTQQETLCVYGSALRQAVTSPGTTPLIGVYDMYSASIAAQHYDGFFVSGFGFAASYYGLPDIGFIAWPDMVAFAERLRLAFPGHHLLVDIDDGYVDPEVACHVVQRLEKIGASGVILEDQKRPRRCGHADGKLILPLEEYLEKLNLVLESRNDLRRRRPHRRHRGGRDPARAPRLAETDADVVLVDGVRSVEASTGSVPSSATSRCCSTRSRAASRRGSRCPN